MDGPFEKELDGDELIALVGVLGRELAAARGENTRLRKRIEEINGRSPATRLDESYSLQAEERRREKRHKQKCRQKSSQRRRRKTQNKLDQAQRTEVVCPEGFSVDECELHRERPVWRVENGAVLVNQAGKTGFHRFARLRI